MLLSALGRGLLLLLPLHIPVLGLGGTRPGLEGPVGVKLPHLDLPPGSVHPLCALEEGRLMEVGMDPEPRLEEASACRQQHPAEYLPAAR